MILLCLLSSFFFFYRAQSWLAFAPVILASVLTLRLRQANRRKVWKFSATFVEAYSEAIKSGRSATDAKQAAFAAVGEANLFAAGTSAGSPLYHDLFSLLRWRSYVPRTDENLLAQMNDARLLSNQLLEINGLPAEQEE